MTKRQGIEHTTLPEGPFQITYPYELSPESVILFEEAITNFLKRLKARIKP